jgi:hypothetical protein
MAGLPTRDMGSRHRFVVQRSPLLRFTRDRGILADADFKDLEDLRNQAGKLTWRFYSSLNKPQAL